MEVEERIKNFLSAMTGDKEEQLAISQCLDLETTRAWLYNEIGYRFYRIEEEERKENKDEIEITKKTTLQPDVELEEIEEL